MLAAALVLVSRPRAAARRSRRRSASQFSAYGPSQLDVLPGETVSWTNVSLRTHTVTSDTGLFDSDDIDAERRFTFTFNGRGRTRTTARSTRASRGEIDVRRVILDPLPTAAVPVGDERRVQRPHRRRRPCPSRSSERGRRSASRRSRRRSRSPTAAGAPTLDGRADRRLPRSRRALDVSETRRLLVGIRKVHVHADADGDQRHGHAERSLRPVPRRGVPARALRLVAAARARLDYVSEAELKLRGPARVRVVLVDKDGWTPIATSAPVVAQEARGREEQPTSCVIAGGRARASKRMRALPLRSTTRV